MDDKIVNIDLLKFKLFAGLKSADIDDIKGKLVCRVRKYCMGQIIAESGEEMESLMLLLDGELIGEMLVPEANDLRIEHIHEGEIIAPAFLFGERNLLPVTLIAREASRVVFISRNDLIALFQISEQVLTNFLNILSEKGQFLVKKLHFLTFRDLRQKLADYILEKCGEKYLSFEMTMTQEEIAKLFGVARTSVVRAINSMEKEGLIKLEKRIITVVDKAALKQI